MCLKTDRLVSILEHSSLKSFLQGQLAVLTEKGAEMSEEDNELVMKIEEAILYVLAERNGGLRTEQIAEIINRRKLHVRKDGQPVTSAQVYAVVMHHPDSFVKAEGRIMLMI